MKNNSHIGLTTSNGRKVTSVRLTEIAPDEIVAHMSDPHVAEHMPLLTFKWDGNTASEFIVAKEEYWRRDGLGHWGLLYDGIYAGWGGFQKEDGEWDFGLVLKPEYFGLGMHIAKTSIEFAKADDRIPFITFLLAPSRKHSGALTRLGARFVGETTYADVQFRKYRLDIK
jgi:hypothetical protein